MAELKGIQPVHDRGHPMPRRTTPERSITLHHHRLAWEVPTRVSREATARASARENKETVSFNSSARRKPSDESFGTRNSDPKKWFEQSNQHPTVAFDTRLMDVDPPFFQRERDSSNEEHRAGDMPLRDIPYGYVGAGLPAPRLDFTVTHSSSADDYRSVIDDLTVENKRLKEELKRYRQFGANTTRKDKLFEIKVHGLGKRKKRELESTLRDFAASLEGPSETTSQSRKPGKHVKNVKNGYPSGSGECMSLSKHASSSSSLSRPVDSAYASMSGGGSRSRGPVSTGPFDTLSLPQGISQCEDKLEAHIRDTPDGLYPRHVTMTDREKKKIVVRKLEQLFTGKIGGRSAQRSVSDRSTTETSATDNSAPPTGSMDDSQAMREAQFQPPGLKEKETRRRKNVSPSGLSGEQAETDRNGSGTGAGDPSGVDGGGRPANESPGTESPPEQRPTRPGELDPDRVQIPADNLDYIRHLGMVPPEFVLSKNSKVDNVSPDVDGWVYLNLLGNLAQLHMFSVTPAFIRSAVTEMSAKFQLSPDGRKIRWRGGTHGTRFSSDSSAGNSQKSPSTDDTDGSNEEGLRKKQKTSSGAEGDAKTSTGSGATSKFGRAASAMSDTFHYKPRFVHHLSSMETSLEGSGSQPSSVVEVENSNPDNGLDSRWGYSGSGSTPPKKRRTDGAIIYFGGAPFCIDLSGDPGDASPMDHFADVAAAKTSVVAEPQKSTVSSSMSIEPIDEEEEPGPDAPGSESIESSEPASNDGDSMEDVQMDFPGCRFDETRPCAPKTPLSPSGLGGVYADDSFRLVVKTRRPVVSQGGQCGPKHAADAIVGKLASMSTSSPGPSNMPKMVEKLAEKPVSIQYVSHEMEKLDPPPLPPPTMFFPPFGSDSDDSDGEGEMEDDGGSVDSSSAELISQRANPHQSENDDSDDSDEDLSSNDEEDEDDVDDELDAAGWTRQRGRLSKSRADIIGSPDKALVF